MKEHSASRTAEYMALFRALESFRRPSRIRLFDDPFAYFFLQPALRGVIQLSRTPLLGAAVPKLIDLRWPGARSSGIARTRLIDDYVHASLCESVDQILILGAGFDCRAYQIAGMETTRVFEVDPQLRRRDTRKSNRFNLRAPRCARWLSDVWRDSPRAEHTPACRGNVDLRHLSGMPSGIPCRTRP